MGGKRGDTIDELEIALAPEQRLALGEAEPDGCCGAYRKGPENQCPDCPKKGVGFIVAIERALAKR